MASALTDDPRIEAVRRAARYLTVAFWLASAFVPQLGVSGAWLVLPLALALAACAIPPPLASSEQAAPWVVSLVALTLSLVAVLRVTMGGRGAGSLVTIAVLLLCGELIPVLIAATIGKYVNDRSAPAFARSDGRMRYVVIAAMLLGGAGSAAALLRFPGRHEPALSRALGLVPRTATEFGTYYELGARCPPSCDDGPHARPRGSEGAADDVSAEVAPGLSLRRRRVSPAVTRLQLYVSRSGERRRPREFSRRLVVDRMLGPGQAATISRDESGRFVMVDIAQHPQLVVDTAEGVAYSRDQRPGMKTFHAPIAYVLAALAGVAMTAWFLRSARRTRGALAGQSAWRDAVIELDGMVHFETELPPTPPPAGFEGVASPVVVTRFTTPVGAGYRSDGVVTLDEVYLGSRAALRERLAARATAWEHGALACLLATHAPLAGMCLLGGMW